MTAPVYIDSHGNDDWIKQPGKRRAIEQSRREQRPIALGRVRAYAKRLLGLKFDEDQHPRDEHGRFAHGGTGPDSAFDHLPPEQQAYLQQMADKWHVDPQRLHDNGAVLLQAALKDGEIHGQGAGWYAEREREAERLAQKYDVSTDQVHGVIAALSPRTRWDNDDGTLVNQEHAETVMSYWNTNPVLSMTGETLQDSFDDDRRDALSAAKADGLLHDIAGPIMRGNADNAFRILNGEDPGDVLGGNKTRSFYEQMRSGGTGDVATIDAWMAAGLSGEHILKQGGPDAAGGLDIHVLGAGDVSDRDKIAAGWSPQATVYSLFDDAVHDLAHENDLSVADTQALIWYQMRNGGGFAEAKSSRSYITPVQLKAARSSSWRFVYDHDAPDPDFYLAGDPDDTFDVELDRINRVMATAPATKGSADQPRDDHGRWTSGGSSDWTSADGTMKQWAAQFPQGTMYRAVSQAEADAVRAGAPIAGGESGSGDMAHVWLSDAPTTEYLDPGEVIMAVRVEPDDGVLQEGGPGDRAMRPLPADRFLATWTPPADMDVVPYHLRGRLAEKDWDESQHPRDAHGRFGEGGGWPTTEAELHAMVQDLRDPGKTMDGKPITPDTTLLVFHATGPDEAQAFIEHGVDPDGKPSNLARRRYEAGEQAEYAPGAGIGAGLYVSGHPNDASGYGYAMIAVRVRAGDLSVPPESTVPPDQMGDFHYDVPQALRALNDGNGAAITGAIPASDVTGYGTHDRMIPKVALDEFKAFTEDQHPRDEHGRFASGGGATDRAEQALRDRWGERERTASREADVARLSPAEQRIAAALPQARVDLFGIDPPLAPVVADRIERFAAQFPAAAWSITEVSIKGDLPDGALAATKGNNEDGSSQLYLNINSWMDERNLRDDMHQSMEEGYHPYDDPSAVIDHELGHVISNHLGDVEGQSPSDELFDVYAKAEDDSGSTEGAIAFMHTWMTGDTADKIPFSYALSGGPNEAWAEMVAQRLQGDTMGPAAEKFMDFFLNTERQYKALGWRKPTARPRGLTCAGFIRKTGTKAEFDEGQHPRDEHGRFTSSGDATPSAGPVAGQEYMLTYKPLVGSAVERTNRVRYGGIVDRGKGPTARFTVLDDPEHPDGWTTQLDLYLGPQQLVNLDEVETTTGAAAEMRSALFDSGGFTVHPMTGDVPTTGYQVAIPGHALDPLPTLDAVGAMSDDDLADTVGGWMATNREVFANHDDVYVGGWVDNGLVYLEPSQRIEDREQALSAAQERGQKDIFDNAAGTTITTGDTAAKSDRADAHPRQLRRDDTGRAARGSPADRPEHQGWAERVEGLGLKVTPRGVIVDPTDTRDGKAITKRFESQLADVLNNHLRRQRTVVLQRLKSTKARFHTRHWSPPGEQKIDAGKVVDDTRWRTELTADARPLLVKLYEASGKATNAAILASTGVDPGKFDVDSPSVADMITARTDLIGDASETLTARIRAQIAAGEEAGEDMGQIADRVLATYGDTEEWWADRIAGDEVHAGQMGAAHAAVEAADVAGEKEWVSVLDGRERPTHNEADSQRVPIDEPFQVGADQLMYPHDPSGSPEETCNCRCVVMWHLTDVYTEDDTTGDDTADEKALTKLYDESQHPRDDHGRWATEGGGDLLTDVPQALPGGQTEAAIAKWEQEHGAEAVKYHALMQDWTNVGSSQLGKQAVSGSTEQGRELAHFLDLAPKQDESIFRGTSALHLERGFEFQLSPSSFSHSEGTGEHYAMKVAGGGGHPAVLEVLPGARGLDVGGLSKYPEEREVISGGTFTVVSSETKTMETLGAPLSYEHIVVQQTKPPLKAERPWWKPTRPLTAVEEAMAGTFADARSAGETKLLDQLLRKFEEDQHPRDGHGRFASSDAYDGEAQVHPGAVEWANENFPEKDRYYPGESGTREQATARAGVMFRSVSPDDYQRIQDNGTVDSSFGGWSGNNPGVYATTSPEQLGNYGSQRDTVLAIHVEPSEVQERVGPTTYRIDNLPTSRIRGTLDGTAGEKLDELRTLLLKFEEGQHPRDEHGRFTSGAGGDSSPKDPYAGDTPAERVGDDLAEIVNGRSWGKADKVEDWHDPLQGAWGNNTVSSDAFQLAQSQAVQALDGEGFHGDNVQMAVEGWSYGPGIDNIRLVADGDPDPWQGDDEWRAQGAQEFVRLAAESPVEDDLYRGAHWSERYGDLTPGTTFDGTMSSWSRDQSVAEVFAYQQSRPLGSEPPGPGARTPILMHLEPGAHGVDIAPLGAEEYAWQQEVVVNEPKYLIKSVEQTPDGVPLLHVTPVPSTKALPQLTDALLGETFAQTALRIGKAVLAR